MDVDSVNKFVDAMPKKKLLIDRTAKCGARIFGTNSNCGIPIPDQLIMIMIP